MIVKFWPCNSILSSFKDRMRNDKENIIVNKTFNFAIEIIKYCELLEENKKFIIARQLLKAGTSVGANVREAQKCRKQD
jgi:hypothetical protein